MKTKFWGEAHERFRRKAQRASDEYDRRRAKGERIRQADLAEKHGIALQSLRKYRWRQNRKSETGVDSETGTEGNVLLAPEHATLGR